MAAAIGAAGSSASASASDGHGVLFTEEAVATGAIVEAFQEEAVKCSRTVLLGPGPHATRCAETPFFDTFRDTRRRLIDEGETLDDVRLKLETLNLGRLRVASKGIARVEDGERPAYLSLDKEHQRTEGMYMIGQVAALRSATCRVADLHRTVSIDSSTLLANRPTTFVPTGPESAAAALSADIAIVGVGCLLPRNRRADAVAEDPRQGRRHHRDPARSLRLGSLLRHGPARARQGVSKWGGFLGEILRPGEMRDPRPRCPRSIRSSF
jgi:hypothetical protein